jgi:hypothetical protein
MMACSSACRDTAAPSAAASALAGAVRDAATAPGPAVILSLAIIILAKLVLEWPVAIAAVLELVELGA